ncbi:MAG: rhodanese-like domain-containing protein [Pseudolabrys sp.]|jgi:rhodanese-related sulfurtransferase
MIKLVSAAVAAVLLAFTGHADKQKSPARYPAPVVSFPNSGAAAAQPAFLRGVVALLFGKQLGYPNKVDMNKKIYVQCLTGGRATLAAKQLQNIGFTNVVAVIMDLRNWAKQGHPLVK